MTDRQLQKPGRCCDIVPAYSSHFVLVDGKEWARFDTLAGAESLRAAIVASWVAYYNRRAARLEQTAEAV
jgi:hypothetical protein